MTCDLAEPVYWRGRQWAVTAYGVETLDGGYHIAWTDLDNKGAHEKLLEAMRGHYWVHFDDLTKALEMCAGARSPVLRVSQ